MRDLGCVPYWEDPSNAQSVRNAQAIADWIDDLAENKALGRLDLMGDLWGLEDHDSDEIDIDCDGTGTGNDGSGVDSAELIGLRIDGGGGFSSRGYSVPFWKGELGTAKNGATVGGFIWTGNNGETMMRWTGSGLILDAVHFEGAEIQGTDNGDWDTDPAVNAGIGLLVDESAAGVGAGKIYIPVGTFAHCDVGIQLGNSGEGSSCDNLVMGYINFDNCPVAGLKAESEQAVRIVAQYVRVLGLAGNTAFHFVEGGHLHVYHGEMIAGYVDGGKETWLQIDTPNVNGAMYTTTNLSYDGGYSASGVYPYVVNMTQDTGSSSRTLVQIGSLSLPNGISNGEKLAILRGQTVLKVHDVRYMPENSITAFQSSGRFPTVVFDGGFTDDDASPDDFLDTTTVGVTDQADLIWRNLTDVQQQPFRDGERILSNNQAKLLSSHSLEIQGGQLNTFPVVMSTYEYTVAAEQGVGSNDDDTLDTILGIQHGEPVTLVAASGDTITVTDEAGVANDFHLSGDAVLSGDETMTVRYDPTSGVVHEVSRSQVAISEIAQIATSIKSGTASKLLTGVHGAGAVEDLIPTFAGTGELVTDNGLKHNGGTDTLTMIAGVGDNPTIVLQTVNSTMEGGIKYEDSTDADRFGLLFERENDTVALANQAADGKVQLRVNDSTGGGSGEHVVTEITHDGTDATIVLNDLPTSEPATVGALWVDQANGNVLKISDGP